MCLILVAWRAHPDYPLAVAANRDEFFARPAAAAHFWPDAPQLLAGRDLEAGGTWLGVNRQGCFAALTNYREAPRPRPEAPSRGRLVADFLSGEAGPAAYLDALATRGKDYAGFNLLVADKDRLGWYSNRGPAVRWLAPGIYGLSNHLLDTPWPKLAAAKAAFAQALADLPNEAGLFGLLADSEIVPDASLPATGVALEWERILSAVFVRSPSYGTRASTVLTMRRDGQVQLVERGFGPGAAPLGETRQVFVSGQAPPCSLK